jgi:TRAP-type C4-dicarboxylate transport system permease small subunit
MSRLLALVDAWLQAGGRAAVTIILGAIGTLLAVGVLVRAFPQLSVTGYDEIVELLVAWMIFLGAALLWGQGALYRVSVLTDLLPRRLRLGLDFCVRLLMLLFALVFAVQGYRVAVLSAETTPFLRFPKSLAYASMPVAGILMIAYTVAGLWRSLAELRSRN